MEEFQKRIQEFQKSKYGTMNEGGVGELWFVTSASLRIILVGRTGSGKSATGNSILCRPAFESRLATQPVTRTCQGEMGRWNGRDILVVDTPSIFEEDARGQETLENIADCYLLSVPGPHVLLLVTQLGRFTAQDAAAARSVKQVFGAEAMGHAVVLFTHGEDLGDESLDQFAASTDNAGLRRLLAECGGRYCAFDNRAQGEPRRGQLARLMAVVERLQRERQGGFLSNRLFLRAQGLSPGGGAAGRDAFLAEVRAQVARQRRALRRDQRRRQVQALLGGRTCTLSHCVLSALVILCGLIVLAILMNFCFNHRN